MKTILKVVIGIIGAFIIMGMLFAGCTAFVFNEADKEITKQDKKDKEESKKEYPIGTTKTYEDVDVTVDSVEQVGAPEMASQDGTFYKVAFTIKNNSDEDAMFSTGDFKMQSEGKQFEESMDFPDAFDLDSINPGNEVTGNAYFVDTKGTTEKPQVQLSFSPFMIDTHKVNFK
ncbi:hypothetical protein [Staphylococcus phage vB_Sau_P68]|nr:hypothetical protein [Staphylococcus phage vB_Sau_P68]